MEAALQAHPMKHWSWSCYGYALKNYLKKKSFAILWKVDVMGFSSKGWVYIPLRIQCRGTHFSNNEGTPRGDMEVTQIPSICLVWDIPRNWSMWASEP